MVKNRILIIDDEPLVIVSLLQYLSENDYDVVATNSSEAAISLINPRGLDVIITDYKMEPLDGIEVIKFFRSKGFDGKIILISAFCRLSKTEMDTLKIDFFFEKPFEIKNIHNKLKEWFR
ncbi:MAG: response regulator [Nitrospirota bacterium]